MNELIIICIDNKSWNNIHFENEEITIGKKYISLFSSLSSYYIKNDKGEIQAFSPDRFITLKEYRKRKINNLLNEI